MYPNQNPIFLLKIKDHEKMKNKNDSDLNQILISYQEMRLYFFLRFSHPYFLN